MEFKEINKIFNDFGKYMVTESQKNLKSFGKGNGPLYNSISYNVKDEPNKVIFDFFMEDYGLFQDQGVKGANPKKLSSNAQITGQQAPTKPFNKAFENLPNELFDGFAVDFIDAINIENKQ